MHRPSPEQPSTIEKGRLSASGLGARLGHPVPAPVNTESDICRLRPRPRRAFQMRDGLRFEINSQQQPGPYFQSFPAHEPAPDDRQLGRGAGCAPLVRAEFKPAQSRSTLAGWAPGLPKTTLVPRPPCDSDVSAVLGPRPPPAPP